VKLAKCFGFTGSSEQGAFDAIVATLTGLAPGGNPIPPLTDILKYHVAGTALATSAIAAATSIGTLSGRALNPFGLSLGDLDPTAADPRIIAARANLQTGNGVIQAIDRVLLPQDLALI
jgi:uncharacterized surface protein with fasciclin (FAS1) repeats